MRLPFAVDSLACARVAIMLIPSYTAAALAGEMVWTIPTLAGASALAASLKRPEDPTRAVDAAGGRGRALERGRAGRGDGISHRSVRSTCRRHPIPRTWKRLRPGPLASYRGRRW